MANQVTITFAGDDKSLSKTLGNLDSQTGKTSSGLSKFSTIAKIGAAGALGALGAAAKIGFDELADGQKKSAQTAAVLKSTGQAAGVTQKQVEALASAISNKSGVDDQAIQSGQNMLLTFTNIRNETGKGNKIFDDATRIMTDMSVAMGVDMKGQAIQLGKALNDPVKGVTALSDVGVTFTQKQRDLIKSLVDTGNTAGAQKVILQELQKEFGGSAVAAGQTLPGQLSILKNSFANVAAGVVQALMPALKTMVGVMQEIVGWTGRHETATKAIVLALSGFAAAIIGGKGVVNAINVFKTAFGAINSIMSMSPIGRIALAAAAIGAALVAAYKASPGFRNAVGAALAALKPLAEAVAAAFQAVVSALEYASSRLPSFLSSAAAARRAQSAATFSAGVTARQGNIVTGGIVPHAMGGIFSSPHIGMVGDAGPEAVIPLSKPGRAAQIMAMAGLGGGGGTVVYNNISVSSADPQTAATLVIRAIDEWERRNGRRFARA